MTDTMTKKEVQRPIKYEVYKTAGAFQFRLVPAYTDGMRSDEGCVFVECSHSTGKQKYAFKEKKIVIALNANDVSQFLIGIRSGQCQIVHDPEANTENAGKRFKKLSLQKGSNDKDGLPTWFLEAKDAVSGEEEAYTVKIPINAKEAKVLELLLSAAIPKMLGW